MSRTHHHYRRPRPIPRLQVGRVLRYIWAAREAPEQLRCSGNTEPAFLPRLCDRVSRILKEGPPVCSLFHVAADVVWIEGPNCPQLRRLKLALSRELGPSVSIVTLTKESP